MRGEAVGPPATARRAGRPTGPCLVGVLCSFIACAPLAAASIGSQVALPVPEDEWVLRGLGVYRALEEDPGPRDRELRATGALGVVGYGVSGRVALFAALPWLRKELDLTTPAGRVERADSGIGDLRLWTRVMLWRDDRTAEARRIAGIVGIEAPTGDDDERDGLGRLPRPLQLGSGSWDPFAGLVFTWQRLDWELDLAASYQRNTEHEAFRFGDSAELSVSWYYRVLPRELAGGVPGFLYAGLESRLSWQGRNERGGHDDGDSGGSGWLLGPGVQYVTKRWVAEALLQLPVLQDRHGAALETELELLTGVRMNF